MPTKQLLLSSEQKFTRHFIHLFDKISAFDTRRNNVTLLQGRQKHANKELNKISDKRFFAVFLLPFIFLIY